MSDQSCSSDANERSQEHNTCEMMLRNLNQKWVAVRYEKMKGRHGFEKVAISLSQERKKSSAPYWVIGILGTIAILLFFGSISFRRSSFMRIETRIMHDQYEQ